MAASGTVGAAVVQGVVTDIIDVATVLGAAA
jgi:hypothetical protein